MGSNQNNQMKTLEKAENGIQGLVWFDQLAPNSEGIGKVEARLGRDLPADSQRLASEFEMVFGNFLEGFLIDNRGDWTFYLLETDQAENHENVQKLEDSYRKLLEEAEIDAQYDGACRCKNWPDFLQFTFSSMLEGAALYSPLFFSDIENWVVYVHRTGEIGIYFPFWSPNLSIVLKNIEFNGGSWRKVREPAMES
jgi:hypothetical protein